jgi:hypothetical protein
MSLPEFFSAIGSDHYLSPREVAGATAPHPQIENAWRLYTDRFDGFCGSRLDPEYWRHEHPAQHLGTLSIDASAPVLVVGTDPSLALHMATLKHVRSQLLLATSPEGAAVLSGHGLLPDLVVVGHQPPSSAGQPVTDLTARRRDAVLARCPLVAVDPRTPAALVATVQGDRLFVPNPLPTWGPWPATAVALAATAGARRIGLLGVDLGTSDAPDSQQRPLAGLLSLLAWTADAACVDCGLEGARKAGWPVASLEEMAIGGWPAGPVVARRQWISRDARMEVDRERLRWLDPLIRRTRALSLLGLRARAGTRRPGDVRAIEDAMLEMLAWGQTAPVRIGMQDTMGLSILPRLWRTGVDMDLGIRLWHPLLMATDELVRQAAKLEARLDMRLCA